MPSRLTLYFQLSVWTIILSLVILLGFWHLVLPSATIAIMFVVAVCGLGWLYLLQHDLRVGMSPFNFSMWLLWAGLLITSLHSIDPSRSWTKVWLWSTCLLAYYMSLTAFRSGWKSTIFIKGFLVVLSIALLFGYMQLYLWLGQWYALTYWLGPLPPRLLRVWGITTSPNEFAILIVFGLIIAIAHYIQQYKMQTGNKSLLLWILVALPMLLMTGSRSGWAALSLGLIALMFGSVWLSRREIDFFSVHILSRLAAASLLILGFIASISIWRRPETLQLSFDSVGTRIPFWRIAVEIWQQSPWLGSGPATYGTFYMLQVDVPFETAYMHAHNLLFNTLAEMGIVGLSALIFLGAQIGYFFLRARHSSNWDLHTIGLSAVLVAFVAHCLFEMPETWVTLLVSVCFAGLTAQLEPQPLQVEIRQQVFVTLMSVGLWLTLLATGFLNWQANQAYVAGTRELESGNWGAAVTQFDEAQSWLPYPDSGISVARGLSYGMLAVEQPDYLSQAESVLVQAVKAEPGWPLNHANLAAVYWEQGKRDQAIKTMQTAISLSPEVPLLYLNLGLWYEAEGNREAAQAIYEILYSLARTPQTISFWEETDIREAAVSQAIANGQPTRYRSPGYIVLDSNPVIAVELFLEEISLYPNLPTAYLGLGIAYAHLGDMASAANALQRAQALDAGHATVRLYGSQQLFINLWQAVLADDQPALLLQGITEQNMLQYGSYSLILFGRLDPPYDLLPQLQCFSQTPLTARHLRWLHTFYNSRSTLSETEQAMFALVNQLRESAGVQSCQVMESR
jgi:tetratricopeptide (TPR) repeat protein/O-antigen ligase